LQAYAQHVCADTIQQYLTHYLPCMEGVRWCVARDT
jgi:hypothetical protein